MSTKHTPGPWFTGSEKCSVYALHERPVGLSGNPELVNRFSLQVQPDGGMYNELMGEMEANAQLIATAPELLELAEDFVAWDNRYPKSSINPYGGARELDELFARARAAIAKATGQ